MRRILALIAACLASLACYVALFAFVLDRPLTVGVAQQVLEKKLAYARQAHGPMIFIIAGSNARFSHSCAVLEKALGRRCANLGVGVDTALDWIFAGAKPMMKPGDVVYLPLEYAIYLEPRETFFTGSDAAYRFRHDKASLASRGAEGLVRAAFLFDIGAAIRSVGEMALAARGAQRRSGLATLDRQGDEIGHGDAQAKPYEALLRTIPVAHERLRDFEHNPDGAQLYLGAFLDWCRVHEVVAVGGLPTMIDGTDLPPDVVGWLQAFYRRHGAKFVVLPNRSFYPRSEFFDSRVHLRDRAQIRHSLAVAAALRPLLTPKRGK